MTNSIIESGNLSCIAKGEYKLDEPPSEKWFNLPSPHVHVKICSYCKNNLSPHQTTQTCKECVCNPNLKHNFDPK